MMDPSLDQLVLVVSQGNGKLVRALGVVRLAKRRGREEELREILEESKQEGAE